MLIFKWMEIALGKEEKTMWKSLVGAVGLSIILSGCVSPFEDNDQYLRYANDRISVYDSRYQEELVVYKKNANPTLQFLTMKDVYLVDKPKDDREKVFKLFELMKLKKEGSQTTPVIPENFNLIDAKVQDDVVTLNFDDSFMSVTEENQEIVLKTIADTMKISFLTAKTLRIEVKGKTVTDWAGVDLHNGVQLR